MQEDVKVCFMFDISNYFSDFLSSDCDPAVFLLDFRFEACAGLTSST